MAGESGFGSAPVATPPMSPHQMEMEAARGTRAPHPNFFNTYTSQDPNFKPRPDRNAARRFADKETFGCEKCSFKTTVKKHLEEHVVTCAREREEFQRRAGAEDVGPMIDAKIAEATAPMRTQLDEILTALRALSPASAAPAAPAPPPEPAPAPKKAPKSTA